VTGFLSLRAESSEAWQSQLWTTSPTLPVILSVSEESGWGRFVWLICPLALPFRTHVRNLCVIISSVFVVSRLPRRNYVAPRSDRVGRCNLSFRGARFARDVGISFPPCHSERNNVKRRIWLGTICVVDMPTRLVIPNACEESVREYFFCLCCIETPTSQLRCSSE